MAQPLLRKTLSRLRSKERLRSKKAAPAPQNEPVDPSLELPDDLHLPCEPKSVDSVLLVDGCQKNAAITVSRKENWPKFTWSCQEDSHNRRPCQSFSPVPQAPADIGFVATGLNKDTELLANYPETRNPSLNTKYSNQGAYLQTLEKSSRQWVLSTGKTQGVEEGASTSAIEMEEFHKHGNSQGEIWYNPIPEDEDLQLPFLERKCGSSSENRDKKKNPIEVKVPHECIDIDSSLKAVNNVQISPIQLKRVKQVEMLGNHQSETYGKIPVATVDPEESSASATLMAQNTNANKKSHSFSKTKSPGPVRSLSMKMKKLPELRRKLSLRSSRPRGPEGSSSAKESGNVISRYHLDSSVVSQQPVTQDKAASNGGYLSDSDSPELLAKTEACLGLEESSFWLYSFAEQPSCLQHFSGLVSIHLLGIQGFKPPKAETKELFCILQVDSVNKARTALLPCQAAVLTLNHSFQLELEDAQLLRMAVFSCDPTVGKNRVCCHGTIILPQVFQGCKTQQLALQLEPQGLLYIKLTLVDRWDPANSEQEPQVFGVKLNQLVKKEGAAIKVPLLIQKCVTQIEKRGLKAVGLYRLCGSAAVKKELHDAFERDSAAVVLSEDLYPDINVITGILKDYLRELPTPLITDPLYQVVLEAMSNRTVGLEVKETTTALLNCLPEAEKATLTMLLDHLSLVAAFHTFNRMNAQNLAVCFGPVLLSQWAGGTIVSRSGQQHCTTASTRDFKHHLEVLHYLLQTWPVPHRKMEDGERTFPSKQACHQCNPPLDLQLSYTTVTTRSHPRGLESPPRNRYAGDWSVCGQQFLGPSKPGSEADYDEVAGSESDREEENEEGVLRKGLALHSQAVYMGDFALVEDPETPFSPRLNLKDFDALIVDLERELSKQINICL
ncbi:rho GTPase-activating protein SYDE1 isoform X1 [Pantherophis guttatus]|uniref:Rho GTPase-activating protein SYDE1 n=1 Tax=Pantherophis guttatus TaxID=94885 RepID=A0A6P9DRD0_PANGU|nr:rho GTPase-activating protein SYDE1 isoform X1 [Pantherophis guttatus]